MFWTVCFFDKGASSKGKNEFQVSIPELSILEKLIFHVLTFWDWKSILSRLLIWNDYFRLQFYFFIFGMITLLFFLTRGTRGNFRWPRLSHIRKIVHVHLDWLDLSLWQNHLRDSRQYGCFQDSRVLLWRISRWQICLGRGILSWRDHQHLRRLVAIGVWVLIHSLKSWPC